MVYKVEGESITLVKYIGSSGTIYIPREIDGKTVTKIASGFYSAYRTTYVYIPREIEIIESKAFENTNTYTYNFYLEKSAQPSSWDTCWYYNSYYGSTTKYVSKNWSSSLSY